MRIACVLDVDYEDSEFKEPYDAFPKAGHQLTIAGPKAGIDPVRPDQLDAEMPVFAIIPAFIRESFKLVEKVPVGSR